MVLIISKNKSVYVFQNAVYLLKTFWVSQLYTVLPVKNHKLLTIIENINRLITIWGMINLV